MSHSYWSDSLPTAAAMTIYLVLVFSIHALPNIWFGEFEFATSALKIIAMLATIITCICIAAGVGSDPPVEHNYNWNSAPAFPHSFKSVAVTFTYAAWATGGQEIMGLSAGEAKMPRWDMPRACNNLFARILVLYEVSVILITVLVPYTDERLLGSGTVAASPFVIAMTDAGIKGLPDFLNAIILLGLVAIGAESLYISSRCMVSMSRMNMFPKWCGRVDRHGRPYTALIVTAIGATICTYINCSSTGGIIFTWFSSISATCYFISWMVIAVSNIRMRKAIKVQNDDVWQLPYAWKLRAFPATAVYLFVMSAFVLFSAGYVGLFPPGVGTATAEGFFQIFLGPPVWLAAFLGYKLYFRTSLTDLSKVDLKTGRYPLTEKDIEYLDNYYSQPWYKRALSYVRF